MAQFKSWDSYGAFRREITQRHRYVRTPDAEEFLRTVASNCKHRLRSVPQGTLFWRAQLGHASRPVEALACELDVAFAPERMKPRQERAKEGRANPKGIPCLYLSTTRDAAMSEVRPWVGAFVSVAEFSTTRGLTIVDCSVLHGQFFKLAYSGMSFDASGGLTMPAESEFERIVWAAIDTAFSEPVTDSDDSAEYAATQTIADLFRAEGYDGIAYKSAFGDDGYSVALFKLDDARQLNGKLHRVETVTFKFRESPDDEYFVREDGTAVRTVITSINSASND